MLGKIAVVLFVIVASVNSEPIRRSITVPNDLSNLLSSKAELFEIAIKPETITSITNLVKSVIGYKISALALIVKIVNWLSSNFVGIAIGGMVALGVCKITGKCNLNYDHSLSKISSFLTPERMEMAQNFLMNAINMYAQDDEEEMEFE